MCGMRNGKIFKIKIVVISLDFLFIIFVLFIYCIIIVKFNKYGIFNFDIFSNKKFLFFLLGFLY